MYIVILVISLLYITYELEKQSKLSFIQLEENKRLNFDMQALIVNLPEAVLIVDKVK